jgi:hypothetical protein
MRIGSVALALVVIAACGSAEEPHGLSVSEVKLERAYRLQDCITQGATQPSQCAGWVSVHWGELIDSSRLVLNAQNQVTRTVWLTTNTNACNMGQPPCPASSKSVRVMSGSYGVTATGISATVGGYSVLFASQIPTRVDASWAGPDSLNAENPLVNPTLLGQKMRFK